MTGRVVAVGIADVLAIAELLIALREICEWSPAVVECALGRYGDRFEPVQIQADVDRLVRILARASTGTDVVVQGA